MKKGSGFRIALIAIVLGSAAVVFQRGLPALSSHNPAGQAAVACSRQDWPAALSVTGPILERQSDDKTVHALAGIAHSNLHHDEEAIAHLTKGIETPDPRTRAAALAELGWRYLKIGLLAKAEKCFRDVLSVNRQHVDAHRRLMEILSFEGRCLEAAPHLMAVIRAGDFRADELILLGIPERVRRKDDRLREQCEKNDSGDPLYLLGRARIMVTDHRLNEAEPLLKRIVGQHPQIGLAAALLGEVYLEQERFDDLLAWEKALTPTLRESPHVWYILGLWAQRTQSPESAAHCLLRTFHLAPSHVKANYLLSQVFQQLGDRQTAGRFSERSLLLSRLSYVVNDLQRNPDLNLMQQAAETLVSLGRNWEAIAWCKVAGDWEANSWSEAMYRKILPRVNRSSGAESGQVNPFPDLTHADFPAPVWRTEPSTRVPTDPTLTQSEPIRFVDKAEQANLHFQYFNSMNPDIGLEHIFQTTGGGAAALDYDGDLRPDLYFGNGCVLPEDETGVNAAQDVHFDRLFRNHGSSGTFHDVTFTAGLGDDRFSQGVTSGDYDNDGFADLYVANLGGNRLYRNNGDGTFSDVTADTQTGGNEWTMSAMIADVNGDGLSDIYAVNYLDMAQVFARVCRRRGEPLTCAPTLFSAEQDRIYQNMGDGSFRDVTDSSGIVHTEGKGLGIVALKRDGQRGLNLFIANDTTENLYFENRTADNFDIAFQENAVLAGLAMNEAGNMQACMGVAAADADNDGLVDLFVTNFFADSNTVYSQMPTGTFVDTTRNAALAEPSYGLVGFGTQFLDADLDGYQDLLVTNGHVDPASATGETDRMPSQFFVNDGTGRFQQAESDAAGPFFERMHLGRALTRLDWNGDSRDDAVIVYLDAPAALVTNESQHSNSAVSVRLRGTVSSRDAIGSSVAASVGDRRFVRHATGGDGYQSYNEQKLTFGLGNLSQTSDVTVKWPNGHQQVCGTLEKGSAYIVIENKGSYLVPR